METHRIYSRGRVVTKRCGLIGTYLQKFSIEKQVPIVAGPWPMRQPVQYVYDFLIYVKPRLFF